MGERLGRYLLLRPLASGGMGEIFLAEHTGLSGFAKRVVLKRIRPELARSPSYVELFLNEARVGSFLNHPNIVHIFDVGHVGDDLFLVMEYVDGVDLKRLVRRSRLAGGALGAPLLAAVIVEVLVALEEAHSGGPTRGEPIIHRDLSPENVLVARSGAVKVLDFGLAKWVPGRASVPSLEGKLIFGKTRYMPPEQLRGELIDVRADIWSLGVLLYEALRGALPFGAGNANSVLASILVGGLRAPTSEHVRPDPELDAIVLRALRTEPGERFQSAREMREALLAYLAARGVHLPQEQLRALLQPGSAIARAATGSEGDEHADRVPTEIGLAVARRCGKCGGAFSAMFHDGLIIDRCQSCEGLWFDHGEIARILGDEHADVSASPPPTAPLDRVLGSCPTCKVGLSAYPVPSAPASFEVCGVCFGVWLDAGEIALLRQEGVVTWFRTLLDSIRAVA